MNTKAEWEEIRTPSEILRDSLWSIKFQSMEFKEFDKKVDNLIKKYDTHHTSTIIERLEGLKEKTFKYKGVSQIDADFSNVGGKKIKKGDVNKFETILTEEEIAHNSALDLAIKEIKKEVR